MLFSIRFDFDGRLSGDFDPCLSGDIDLHFFDDDDDFPLEQPDLVPARIHLLLDHQHCEQ